MSEFTDVFSRSSKLVRGAMEQTLRRHGLHLGQNFVLAALAEEDGQTPGAIAQALHVTTPTVVKMANRMTAAGMVTRRRDTRDNRLVRLHLTDEGRALVDVVERELDELGRALTAGMPDRERAALLRALRRIADNARALDVDPVDAPD